MGPQRKSREWIAGGTEDGTAHERKSRGSAKRGGSPGKREERVDRQVRQKKTEDMGRGDEEEKAIEALLQQCRERAEGYELGGAALVEKSPGGALGRAEEESLSLIHI